jgi:hypothetical protein
MRASPRVQLCASAVRFARTRQASRCVAPAAASCVRVSPRRLRWRHALSSVYARTPARRCPTQPPARSCIQWRLRSLSCAAACLRGLARSLSGMPSGAAARALRHPALRGCAATAAHRVRLRCAAPPPPPPRALAPPPLAASPPRSRRAPPRASQAAWWRARACATRVSRLARTRHRRGGLTQRQHTHLRSRLRRLRLRGFLLLRRVARQRCAHACAAADTRGRTQAEAQAHAPRLETELPQVLFRHQASATPRAHARRSAAHAELRCAHALRGSVAAAAAGRMRTGSCGTPGSAWTGGGSAPWRRPPP